MKVLVQRPYQRPYENPIAVAANEAVTVDFQRLTEIEGWVWCTASDGRSGWAPRSWLVRNGDRWFITRDFNAIELSIEPGEVLEITAEESGFYWARKQSGQCGWIPCTHVEVLS